MKNVKSLPKSYFARAGEGAQSFNMGSLRQDLAHFPQTFHAKEEAIDHGDRQEESEDEDEDEDWESDNESMILGTTPHVSPPIHTPPPLQCNDYTSQGAIE